MSTISENGVVRPMTPEELAQWEADNATVPMVFNDRVPFGDWYAGALLASERKLIRQRSNPQHASHNEAFEDQVDKLRRLSWITLGDDMSDPERQRTEGTVDWLIAEGVLAAARKTEVLAWRPGDEPVNGRAQPMQP